MKHIIIGTAGHVDHGKTALIKALTGMETDRLKEEKARGISIDLGFAIMKLSDEFITGIVVVPGHERFLKNMLAGTGSIDLVMLVIAADEGVMPQTKEHLAMLHLYGIQHGVVVINKIDKVEAEWLELVEEEILALVKDTFLAGAPFCRVSATTGEGVDGLKESLLIVAKQVTPRDESAPFRLWIDRVFTVKGYGVVVTGSVLSGSCHSGDHLTLYPSQQQIRVRGMEWHGHKVETIFAGQRAAINVAGVDGKDIGRGMFLSHDGYGLISSIWDVMVDWQQSIASGTRVRLHLGTGEFLGRIYSFKNSTQNYMRMIMEEPLAGSSGDKGIIRLYSPQYLLGGITLIAPSKGRRVMSEDRMKRGQALKSKHVTQIVYQVLAESPSGMSVCELMRQTGYINKSQVDQSVLILVEEKKVIMLDEYYMAKRTMEMLRNNCIQLLTDYHGNQPERAGLSRELIRQRLGLSEKVVDKVLTYWQGENHIVCNNGEIALQEHFAKFKEWQHELLLRCENILIDTELMNIDADFLCQKLNISPDQGGMMIKILLNKGILIQIENIFIYSKTIKNVIRILHQHFQASETITVAQLRDLLNTSRKMVLPLLEYLDVNKYTIRTGDVRRQSLKIVDFSEE